MKNIFFTFIILVLSSSAFALDCKGLKVGSSTAVKTLEDAKRSYPYLYLEYDNVTMHAITIDNILVLKIINTKNSSQVASVTISNFTQNQDFLVSTTLITEDGTYKLICQ